MTDDAKPLGTEQPKCCKCEAYRQIIADQAAELARVNKQLATAVDFCGHIIRVAQEKK